MKKLLLIFLLPVLLYSCDEDTPQSEIDDKIIMDYLISTNLDIVAIKHSSGLYYTIDRKGTGEYIGSRTKVKVYYKGYFTDSSLFDESGGTPVIFTLSGLYTGWQIGIPLFDKGSKGKLFLPSNLAARDGQVRIFEIDVLNFY